MAAAAKKLDPNPAVKFGKFCTDVARHTTGLDPRAAAPTTIGSEGVGGDGGVTVPPYFRQDVVATLLGESSLLPWTFLIPTPSNSAWFPTDAAPPWTSSGVVSTWEGEATPPLQVKPSVGAVSVKLNKQTVFVPMSSELYEDSPTAGVYLSTVVRDRMLFKMNDAILNGDGVGKPGGILNGGALVVQTKESGQTAGTFLLANARKMWSRLYAPAKARAIWIANPDLDIQLQDAAAFPFPSYLPAGVAGNGLPLLLGRPVVFTEAAPALGSRGDVVLADMTAYATAVRVSRALRPGAQPLDPDVISSELSMDVFFDLDLAALRFTMRATGQPIWSAAIARTKSQPSVSPFVALEAR